MRDSALSFRYLAIVAAAAAGCAGPATAPRPPSPAPASTDARRVLDGAIAAVGGAPAIAALRTVVVTGEGELWVLGQGRLPTGESISLRATDVTLAIDLAHGRMRLSQVLTPLFPYRSPMPQREVTALDGDLAFDLAADGTISRADADLARERRDDLRHELLVLLRAALAPTTVVTNHRRDGADDVIDIQLAAGDTYTLAIDAATHLPRRLASPTIDPTLGDVTFEATLDDYRPAGALRLPHHITTRLDRALRLELRAARIALDAPIPDLVAPAAVRAPLPPSPAPVLEALAANVWLVGGGSHHSVLVERADHLLLIEAPVGDERTLAAIAAARAKVPNKPLTHVVVTHHHFDHAGGVRAAVSEGLTVIAHEAQRAFLEELVVRPRTRVPDALSRQPRPLSLVTVSGERTLPDPLTEVRLFSVDSRHAGTMLVAYLPRDRLLVEVDLYALPPPDLPSVAYPHALDLLRAIEDRKLAVDRIVPLHRGVASLADLRAAAALPRP